MAEPLGIASGALQVADAGLKLAKTLYNYLDAVRKADKDLKTLAREVTVTSSTLRSLGNLLKEQNAKQLYTEDLVSEARVAFDGCQAAFTEVDVTFKSVVRFDSDGKPMVTPKGRWVWPLKKGNVEMLQANLERLKTTLLLMLSVLSFARETARQPAVDDTRVAVEKLQIENLIKAQQDANERYNQLVTVFQELVTKKDPSQNVTNIAIGIFGTAQVSPTANQTTVRAAENREPTDEISRHLSLCAEAVSRLSSMLNSAGEKWQAERQLDISTIQESLSHIVNSVQCLHESRARSASQDSFGPPTRLPDDPPLLFDLSGLGVNAIRSSSDSTLHDYANPGLGLVEDQDCHGSVSHVLPNYEEEALHDAYEREKEKVANEIEEALKWDDVQLQELVEQINAKVETNLEQTSTARDTLLQIQRKDLRSRRTLPGTLSNTPRTRQSPAMKARKAGRVANPTAAGPAMLDDGAPGDRPTLEINFIEKIETSATRLDLEDPLNTGEAVDHAVKENPTRKEAHSLDPLIADASNDAFKGRASTRASLPGPGQFVFENAGEATVGENENGPVQHGTEKSVSAADALLKKWTKLAIG